MTKFSFTGFPQKAFKAFLVSFLIVIAACSNVNSRRVLMSMSISPASADAHNSPNGQVAFTATGNFSQPPSPATVTFQEPYTGTWMVSNTNTATIDQNGVAQCMQGQGGTVTVSAIVSSNSAQAPAMSTAVTGTAMLTCP